MRAPTKGHPLINSSPPALPTLPPLSLSLFPRPFPSSTSDLIACATMGSDRGGYQRSVASGGSTLGVGWVGVPLQSRGWISRLHARVGARVCARVGGKSARDEYPTKII